VRGWKSGRNCERIVTTAAFRRGAVRTATFPQAIGPDPTTWTLASGDNRAVPPPARASRASAPGATITARSKARKPAAQSARRLFLSLLPVGPNVDGRVGVLNRPVPPVARVHRPSAERANAHPVTEDRNASLTPIPALLAFSGPSPMCRLLSAPRPLRRRGGRNVRRHSVLSHRIPRAVERCPSDEGLCPHLGLGPCGRGPRRLKASRRGLEAPPTHPPRRRRPGPKPGAPTECRPGESPSP